ncbi:MAG TPA: glycosyltransferase [Candidatus Sulfotelmatobacter sp.]|jgi:exo-beta-1,3-glucanase (GH17 family)/cellulose synthase/poly-beta-1,6-N-acetylglucosamine synthase-like glycosyltransferase|nr:glycosyltransferase [Candidatus Sulfotelmatobacter sp.]
MLRRFSGLAVLFVIVLGNLGVWWLMNRPATDVAWDGQISSISFSAFRKDDDPFLNKYPPLDSIDQDLALVATKVKAIRLYNSSEGHDQDIPALAAKHGLTVTAGAWIRGALAEPNLRLDKQPGQMNPDELKAYQLQMAALTSNEQEIDAAIEMARANPNVSRIIIGNETIYRGEATVAQLIRYINRVKAKVRQPVSTAEPAYVWLSHPELVREADFIALHVLPYWEGIPVEDAVDYVMGEVQAVKNIYPDKPIMLAEVGWPSAGKGRQQSEPSVINQARFLRRFLNQAEETGLDYNVIEAFDQPWKKAFEWTVGTHWGVWDADRHLKFSMVEPVLEIKQWPMQALTASLIALLPLSWLLFNWKHLRTRGKVFYAVLVQFSVSLMVWTGSVPMIRDFAPSTELMYSVMMPAQFILLVVVLIAGYEMTELTWARQPRRGFTPETSPKPTRFPKVSLHLPCYNEPPDMMIQTLDSLTKLDYPNFEVLVLDNNTRDPEVWKPVQQYCAKLGDRFKFYHLGKWPGAKSGALNFALTQTDPDAEVIGVIDSDYQVTPDWLSTLVPYFENPKVGWVQAPQDHREWDHDLFKECINWEYAGFFDIGMVARNEDNAIIQHGTMTLIRRAALEDTGKWSEWTITEDAELGLRLLEHGYESVYLSHRFGHGLTPDNFTAYKKQRFRWAYGAVQILKGHWRALIPFKKTGLTASQKYHFVTGWLPWFADAFYVLFTILSVFWTIGLVVAPRIFDFPLAIFVMPTVGVFVAKLVHHLFLYSTRVKCNWRQRIGSAIAGMGLTYYIGKAMWQGVFTKTIPFLRTPKCEDKAAWTAGFMMASEETVLMLSQWICAVVILWIKGWNDIDARMWALVLSVQSIPYAAALATAMISALPTEDVMKRLNKNKGQPPMAPSPAE